MDRFFRSVALAAIRAYQKYLSPHKGFACAYREHTGHASCSALGYRAIRRYGVWGGWKLIRQRTYVCGVAYRRYQPVACTKHTLHLQRGVIDLDCGDCACDGLGGALELFSACDGCSVGSKRSEGEKYVYIPPKVKRHGAASTPKGARAEAADRKATPQKND